MIVTIDGLPVYRAELNGEDTGMYCISLVDSPAVLRDFQKLSKQEREDREAKRQLYAITDEDKHLVRGVVMRADFPIYRRDNFEYYIIYKPDTIRAMAEKYLADKLQNQVNLDHEEGAYVEGVQMVQWYIKDTAAGLNPEGFEDCADGSLFAEFHIADEDIWQAIKEGTYRGFSLEGYFELRPEEDKESVEKIVEQTKGLFWNNFSINDMSKFTKFLNAMRQAVAFRTATSDKGLIAWEGDDDLAVGNELFVEDENGNRTAAEDGTYTLTDGTIVVVTEGKVESITEPSATEENFGEVSTDKGTIRWEGEEDLKAGDSVYRINEDGERAEVEDGAYTTEDGKIITVENGVVVSIEDPAAEVEARRQARFSRLQKFFASYEEKYAAIYDAIHEKRGQRENEEFYVVEAGDDYAVIEVWDYTDYSVHFFRYAIKVSEDAQVTIEGDEQEVKQMWVPIDYVSPFETEEEAVEAKAELSRLRKENEKLKAMPAAVEAHKAVSVLASAKETKRENLLRILNARR